MTNIATGKQYIYTPHYSYEKAIVEVTDVFSTEIAAVKLIKVINGTRFTEPEFAVNTKDLIPC